MQNPLLASWEAREFQLPPFGETKTEHFAPALQAAMDEHLREVLAIAACTEAATFENVALALDGAGRQLDRVCRVFSTLTSSVTNPGLQEVERDVAPKLAAHSSKVFFIPGLFARLDALHAARNDAGLAPDQVRLVERLHLDFSRAGARFGPVEQARYGAIMERLAELNTAFGQNVLGDEEKVYIEMAAEADMAGCPPDVVAAAKAAAVDRGLPGYVVTLSRSSVEPFLVCSDRRDLREKAWRAWTRRGEIEASRHNNAIIIETLQLRAEQAALHGAPSFAAYQIADCMAKTPEAVLALLENVWPRAKAAAERERAALEEYNRARGLPDTIAPWDWRYVAEKVREQQYAFDEAEMKPYLSLDAMVAALFDVARRLFGLHFLPRPDLHSFHPDVKTYEVREGSPDGRLIALFLADNFARTGKQSGAWMSELRTQAVGEIPVITNNNNFTPPARGEPALLSFDDCITLFHEFGHGCHGMLSSVRYRSLAGTSVLRDFVELPSQLLEHFIGEPEVLQAHAKHVASREPIPPVLLAKMQSARLFGKGFDTVEYSACALVDLALHMLPASDLATLDLPAFEAATLGRLGMPDGIVMRHRPAHFQHLFSSSSYASAYFCYIAAEVLDADVFGAFKEASAANGGTVFDAPTAARLKASIYAVGNSVAPDAAFRAFRGRDPVVEPMLKKKGLLA